MNQQSSVLNFETKTTGNNLLLFKCEMDAGHGGQEQVEKILLKI